MANDIKFIWDSNLLEGDLEINDGDLTRENGLTTAVLISIFTDARADTDDEIDNKDDKRGWWGNLVFNENIGSKLWELERSKTTSQVLIQVEQYLKDALQWMIDDGVVQKIDINVERFGDEGNDRIGFEVILYQTDGNITAMKFDDLWKSEFNLI